MKKINLAARRRQALNVVFGESVPEFVSSEVPQGFVVDIPEKSGRYKGYQYRWQSNHNRWHRIGVATLT